MGLSWALICDSGVGMGYLERCVGLVGDRCASPPGGRSGRNGRYAMRDIGLATFRCSPCGVRPSPRPRCRARRRAPPPGTRSPTGCRPDDGQPHRRRPEWSARPRPRGLAGTRPPERRDRTRPQIRVLGCGFRRRSPLPDHPPGCRPTMPAPCRLPARYGIPISMRPVGGHS